MQEFPKIISTEVGERNKLLIIEPDNILKSLLKEQLQNEGFKKIFEALTDEEAREQVKLERPDLILLGCDQSEKNEGCFSEVDLCLWLRRNGFLKPIIILTDISRQNIGRDCIDAGADYYIVKPLRFSELLSLVRTSLAASLLNDSLTFELFDLQFDLTSKWLVSNVTGVKVALTEKETKIMQCLFECFPKGVEKDWLLSEVWGLQKGLSTHTLATHIYRLRKKIRELTTKPIILTDGTTYKFSQKPLQD